MPARRHSSIAGLTSGLTGSIMPTSPTKLVFHGFRFPDGRERRKRFFGRGQNPQSLVCHGFIRRQNLGAFFVGQRLHAILGKVRRATLQNFVRRALGELQKIAVFVFMHRGHHLAHGVKRKFSHPFQFRFLNIFVKTEFVCKIDERTFRRFADGLFFVGVKLRVRAKRHCSR